MAKRKTETLDDLLASVLPPGTGVVEWAESKGIPQRTLYRMRNGLHAPRLGTLTLLVQAIGVADVDAARVRAAIEASRAQNAG